MNDAPRRRRYRPPGPPLPPWTRGEAIPTPKDLYEATTDEPLLDENGQPVIGRNGVPVTYEGKPKPPFTTAMIADGYRRLMKAQVAEAREEKRREEAAKRRAKKEEPPMDKPLRKAAHRLGDPHSVPLRRIAGERPTPVNPPRKPR